MLRPNTIVFLITISTIAGIHFIALKLYLYWHYVWFDVPMHVLGGAAITLGMFAFSDLRIPPFTVMITQPVAIICFLIAVMISWEVFELWAGVPMLANYRFDTSIDIISGLLGGGVGYFVAKRLNTL